MELTRKQVINTLETLKLEWGELAPLEDNICDALDYAISSLKTDEAYQLMYEGEDVYTKDEVIAMLVALQLQFASHGCKDMSDCWWLIEEKINKLKENI